MDKKKSDSFGESPPNYSLLNLNQSSAPVNYNSYDNSAPVPVQSSHYYQYTSDNTPLTQPDPELGDYNINTTVENCPKEVKMAFLRKVYLILLLQIGLTAGIGALFMFVDSIQTWVQTNYWIVWVNFIPTIIVLVLLVFQRRNFPLNFILLMLFTLLEAYTLGVIVSFVDIDTVLQAVIITFTVFLGLTLFTMQTKIDFSGLGPIVVAALFGLSMMGLMSLFFPYNDVFQIIYCALGVAVFTGLILYDTYSIMNRMTPEEYIMAAVQLYLDIINLFLFILRLLQICKN